MLSILIPAYNYNIAPLVNRLHSQCESAGIIFEIIVLDDGSAANFREGNSNITQLSNTFYEENPANLGRTLSRQKLANLAKYNRLLFLDADVLPVDDNFIKNYSPFLSDDAPVVFGGCAYERIKPDADKILRYTYGIEREEKTAAERNKNPYGTIFSGNLLITKQVFLDNNFTESQNLYGLDNYFSYRLFINNIPVMHIDNPIYHLGLETDEVFFAKSLQSVAVRKQLLANAERIEEINSLLKHYKNLKRFGLNGVTAALFKATGPLLKKRILSARPDLFSLDLYRLGYMCSLK